MKNPPGRRGGLPRGGDARTRARRIRLLVLDVDGVLTDGRMILAERGDELKAFHTKALNMGSVGLDTLKRALLG